MHALVDDMSTLNSMTAAAAAAIKALAFNAAADKMVLYACSGANTMHTG